MSNLTGYIQKLKNNFMLQTGVTPNMLLVPRRTAIVKKFCEELVVAAGEDTTGSVPLVFHRLWHDRAPCEFMGLHVELSDTDDDICVDFDMDQVEHELPSVQ